MCLGTHFHFIREIPILAFYEVRSQIVGWDHKWVRHTPFRISFFSKTDAFVRQLYIVHRFVTHRKPAASRSPGPRSEQSSSSGASAPNGNPSNLNLNPYSSSASVPPIPAIHTPSTPLTNVTPSPSSVNLQAMFARSSAVATGTNASPAAAATAAAAAAAAAVAPEPDGATLHCVSVNVVVFKHGRITVPPTLVLASEGLGATPAQGTEARARALALGLKGMRELYLGGWRAVPEGSDERWWDVATKGLDGRVERRVRKVKGVREGLEGALQVRML